MFGDHLARWGPIPDGFPIVTRSSRLLPVRWRDRTAMLKVAVEAEEKRGGLLMAWWEGEGAARVLAQESEAFLLERAECKASLADLARSGGDDEASRITCGVVAKLHTPRAKPLPELVPLSRWFQDFEPAAAAHGGVLALSAATARALLASPREIGVLHGDIHHENVLDFEERGRLAIDPKGLLGERGFDYAYLFCNPDQPSATAPGRFARRLDVVAAAAGLERKRLLQWILAWAGLSAAWHLGDGTPPDIAFDVAAMAEAALAR